MPENQFILASDNHPDLQPLLRADPTIASSQDSHGYSLVHAAASYNHLDLLRQLVREFHVDVNLRDEDDETALFVVETVATAKVLVEELEADVLARGSSGQTAHEKIAADGEFPQVAKYLRGVQTARTGVDPCKDEVTLPEEMSISVGTMNADAEQELELNSDLRRRIEDLTAEVDLSSEHGQAALRSLLEDAVSGPDGMNGDGRNVRQRQA